MSVRQFTIAGATVAGTVALVIVVRAWPVGSPLPMARDASGGTEAQDRATAADATGVGTGSSDALGLDGLREMARRDWRALAERLGAGVSPSLLEALCAYVASSATGEELLALLAALDLARPELVSDQLVAVLARTNDPMMLQVLAAQAATRPSPKLVAPLRAHLDRLVGGGAPGEVGRLAIMAVATALDEIEDPSAEAALAEVGLAPSVAPGIRADVARSIRRVRQPATVAALLALWDESLETYGDFLARDPRAKSLAEQVGGADVLQRIPKETAISAAAIAPLGRSEGTAELGAQLAAKFSAEVNALRRMLLVSLAAGTGSEAVASPVVRAALGDPDISVRAAAMRACEHVPIGEATPRLLRAAAGDPPALGADACVGLSGAPPGQVEDYDVAAALLSRTADPSRRLRIAQHLARYPMPPLTDEVVGRIRDAIRGALTRRSKLELPLACRACRTLTATHPEAVADLAAEVARVSWDSGDVPARLESLDLCRAGLPAAWAIDGLILGAEDSWHGRTCRLPAIRALALVAHVEAAGGALVRLAGSEVDPTVLGVIAQVLSSLPRAHPLLDALRTRPPQWPEEMRELLTRALAR